MSKRYRRSEELHQRALRTIPLGTQTFSKSRTQYPYGISPYFIARAEGSRVWDVDGNEYIDYINALASITLGYNDPDVTAAVRAQLDEGTIFSLPHPLEVEVAEKIVAMVPCAEQVRFGKNGSDATAGAIRVARAHTGRDRVAVCGYHGWQDWYIGSTSRHLGVPRAVRDLTHTFPYNDTGSLRRLFVQYPGEFAAVILEPMNVVAPARGFLGELQSLTHEHGALLVFDETITGFRFANGGAQEYFGVTPDLATFGKGLANGYPVSALAGKAEYMRLLEDVFFSFTFGGETLSLAAALATLRKLETEPVVETLWQRGQLLLDGLTVLIERLELSPMVQLGGLPVWSFVMFNDVSPYTKHELKTLYLQEMFERGILTIGTHNMSYAHSEADVRRLLAVYEEVFALLKQAVASGRVRELLKCEPLVPLFQLR